MNKDNIIRFEEMLKRETELKQIRSDIEEVKQVTGYDDFDLLDSSPYCARRPLCGECAITEQEHCDKYINALNHTPIRIIQSYLEMGKTFNTAVVK